MSNWKFIDEIFLYDGTFEGLLTIVFDCYLTKEIPSKIIANQEYIDNILDRTKFIITDYEKSDRIFKGICKNISDDTLYNAYYAFLSANQNHICTNKEVEILKYLLQGFVIGPKINTMLSIDYVLNVHKLRKNVLFEAHRLKGLVRFMEVDNNLYYSCIHPENNVIENVGQHFIRRFPTQNFILHDKNRNISMLYSKNDYRLIEVPEDFKITNLSEKEKLFQSLWKTFFETISIKERTNSRLQMQYMPKKYWKDLTEKNLS